MKSETEVQAFERIEQQLHALLSEIAELSKKKANDGVNKFKLKFINVLLEQLNEILGTQKPFKDFEKFDENDLPTNSDVVVMLSQYAAAMFQVRSENTIWFEHEWRWVIKGKPSKMATRDASGFKYGAK